jgi:hypothetical protein
LCGESGEIWKKATRAQSLIERRGVGLMLTINPRIKRSAGANQKNRAGFPS